jgi:hypothetical protein
MSIISKTNGGATARSGVTPYVAERPKIALPRTVGVLYSIMLEQAVSMRRKQAAIDVPKIDMKTAFTEAKQSRIPTEAYLKMLREKYSPSDTKV